MGRRPALGPVEAMAMGWLEGLRTDFRGLMAAAVSHPTVAVVALCIGTYLLRREARLVVAPFLFGLRDGLHTLMIRAAIRTRAHARSISRYRRELDHLTSRSLIEDIVLSVLMAVAFYMGLELSFWVADNPIQSLLDRLGVESSGPLAVVTQEHEFLVGAVITVEVFCGIMLLDLLGGTKVFGIVQSYRQLWRIAYALGMFACIVVLVLLDQAMVRHTIEHLQAIVTHKTADDISAYPADLLRSLRSGVTRALSGASRAPELYGVFSFAIAMIMAVILFPLDILKDMFPLFSFTALLVLSGAMALLLFLALVATCVAVLALTLVFRVLILPSVLFEALAGNIWPRSPPPQGN